MQVPTSVTGFGKSLQLWCNFKGIGNMVWRVYLKFGKILNLLLYFLDHWANFLLLGKAKYLTKVPARREVRLFKYS